MAVNFYDPSQIRYIMSAPPPPPPKKSRVLDILKLLVGFLIALVLIAILIVLIFAPRSTSNTIDVRESNEKIAKLLRESNEKIARLQRESSENLTRIELEQQRLMEYDRQIHQERLIEKHRVEDRLYDTHRREEELHREMEREIREQNLTEKHRSEDLLNERINREVNLALARDQQKQQLEIEEKRLAILSEQNHLTKQHRQEDVNQINGDLLESFIQDIMSATDPLNQMKYHVKVHSLIRRFDPLHKSLLISFLYKYNFLNYNNSGGFDLQGTNLKELNLNKIEDDSEQTIRLNYTQLSLPLTNLINASFEKIDMSQSNFSLSNMKGVSFRQSQIVDTDFSQTDLSLSRFDNVDLTRSNLSFTKIERAVFQQTILSYTQMDQSKLRSTNFQQCVGIQTNFTLSDLSYANFQYAELFQVQMHQSPVGSANFHAAKLIQGDFSRAYMAECLFQWANLKDSSFRYAFLAHASFENADVQNVDFTGAMLSGVHITAGQLDTALSIAHAVLPDGTQGKNKNLIKNGHAQCTDMNDWINDGNVYLDRNDLNTDCAFLAKEINATLIQRVDLYRYERIIKLGQSYISIEMQEKTSEELNPSSPPVYMSLQFFDLNNNQIGSEQTTLSSSWFTPPSTYTSSIACPSTTVGLQATVIFREVNATVDNIYLTIQ